MATKSFTFDLGNRDLTTEELGVVKKARESFVASAARHGVHIAGGVLIKVTSGGAATGGVVRPRGTDIVRQATQPGVAAEPAPGTALPVPRSGVRRA
jgi:hypothetical protein